jgi:N utilization substance protein A
VKLSLVIEELVEERGLDRTVLSKIICEGMLSAYSKKYPDIEFEVVHNKKTDEIDVFAKKLVVQAVNEDQKEITLRKAKSINPKTEIGKFVLVPFDGPIGRIEILKAKQVIAQKIRSIEAEAIYKEFKPKEKTIVHGVIHKLERPGVIVKIGDYFAFLPKSLSVPSEKYIVGHPIRALLKEVLSEPRNENQIILDRASTDFLIALFGLEIPEVYEKLVEIKNIARIPGYKSKVVVFSNDKNIDPVGTCVGFGGARIKPILKELGGEKIDIIAQVSSPEEMIKDALKPAHINRVEMVDSKNAKVWVDEDQRSVAIGKMGQNVALASQLTGVNISIMKNETEESDIVDTDESDESKNNIE